jgi:uncharacterized protein
MSLDVVNRNFAPQLCEGQIVHHRLRPRAHRFTQRVFYLRVPLSKLREISTRWLSRDRFNLLSFVARDYGPRDGSDLATWARAQLTAYGLPAYDGEIVLQTFPRVLGYVFNPISLWFVYDHERLLRAVICEVTNTFGEHHNYLVAHPDAQPIHARDCLIARKMLHVSPFCEVIGHYRFRFAEHAGEWITRIDYHDGPEASDRLLVTSISGAAQPLTSRTTLLAFLRHPFFTWGVVANIHWQALRLWLKRVPWFSKPPPPSIETSL